MTNQQRILVVAVFVVAVLGGGLLAVNLLGGGGSPGPSSIASASATPSAAAATPASPATPTLTPTEAPTPEPTPTTAPSATAKPTTAPGPAATIVFTQLKLDAGDDPDGRDRLVTFTARGTGTVTVTLSTLSPMGSTHMCLTADGKSLGCRTTADGTLTATNIKAASAFELTLRGNGIETPVVEVGVTFPAATPSVTLANARFDGTGYPEWNGIQAIVQARSDGDVRVTAEWGGHPFLYELDLFEQGGSGSETLANQGPATRMDEALPVTAANPWKVLLQNIEIGFGITPMTVTITWP
ncbi:MAG: hypothetical protein ACYC65_09905 [Candidatus Limnocylindrales bacterium]